MVDFDGFSTRKINTNLPCCAKIHTGCTWLDTWCRSAPTPILCPGCINLSSFANATDSGWICIQSHIHTHIYIYTHTVSRIHTHTHIYIYTHSITDMFCCQPALAGAYLLSLFNSSCLCFVAPKQGQDSGPKNVVTMHQY